MARVLIIGCSGFVGQYLGRRLLETPGYEVSGTYCSSALRDEGYPWLRAELTEHPRLEQVFHKVRPEVVVHLAAIADVREAESSPDKATAVNVGGTAHIAGHCAQHGARLVFLSTEYVFSGDRGYYREEDTPQPNTHYGRTKWEAEQAVAREASRWSILRTSMVYGWPPAGHRNMVTTVINRLESGSAFNARANMYLTPVYVERLIDGIMKLVEGHYPGVHHLAGREWMSLHQLAGAVAREFDLDSRLLEPSPGPTETAPGSDGPTGGEPAPRTTLLGLDSTRTARRLGLELPSVAEGLGEMRATRLAAFRRSNLRG